MRLKGTRPQMSGQLELPLEARGEAPKHQRSGEVPMAAHETESSGRSDLMERVVSRPNLQNALKRVKSNKGSPGIDGMTVDELSAHLQGHWVRDPRATARGDLPAPDGEATAHPEERGRDARAWHPDRARPVHPAGAVTGSAVGSGWEFFPAQLRFPAWTECARGSLRGATLRPARTPLGGGRGSGEVLRPRQPRCADGKTRQADQ